MVEREISLSMPSDTRNFCVIHHSNFLETDTLMEKGFSPPQYFFDLISGKVFKNTIEWVGRLCCILLRRHWEEVVGNPWTFFPPLISFPYLSQHIILYIEYRLLGRMEQAHSESPWLYNISSFNCSFCSMDSSVLSFLRPKKRGEWKAPQETLRYQPDYPGMLLEDQANPAVKHSLWAGNELFKIVCEMPSTGWLSA